MGKNKKYLIFLIVCFLSLIIATDTVSAAYYSLSFSSSGKTINMNKKSVNPSFVIYNHTQTYYDKNGYTTGKTITTTKTGTDGKNRTYYRKNVNASTNFKLKSADFLFSSSFKQINTGTSTEKITGSLNSVYTFSGNSTFTMNYLYYKNVLVKRITSLKIYKDGVYYAKCTITETPTYSYKFYPSKWKQTMQTVYANGNTRNSTINTIFTRNSGGTLQGFTTAGSSQGKEKINSKWVTYTGKITIYSKNQVTGYQYGNYVETKTSSSSTLTKYVPLESIFYDEQLQLRANII